MMRRMLVSIGVCMLGVAVLGAVLRAGQGGSSADDDAIRKVQDQFASAWNQHDAAAMSNLWAEDGDWVGPDGRYVQGKARIDDYLAEAHTGDWATSQNKLKITSIRFLTPEVAIVDAEYEITGARDWFDKPIPVEKILATSVMIKQGGTWKNAAYRAFVPPPPSED